MNESLTLIEQADQAEPNHESKEKKKYRTIEVNYDTETADLLSKANLDASMSNVQPLRRRYQEQWHEHPYRWALNEYGQEVRDRVWIASRATEADVRELEFDLVEPEHEIEAMEGELDANPAFKEMLEKDQDSTRKWRWAAVEEQLALAALDPEEQRKHPIIALDSLTKENMGAWIVPVLAEDKGKRVLFSTRYVHSFGGHTFWGKWDSKVRFMRVRPIDDPEAEKKGFASYRN